MMPESLIPLLKGTEVGRPKSEAAKNSFEKIKIIV
jgi:hypothetical protein